MNFEKPRTAGKSEKGVPTWAKPKKGGADQAQYYGMIKCIDDNIKRILDTLKKSDLLDNTVIVFTADHGDMRGEHDRQNKGTPLEASAKVPFLVRYPEKVASGKIINEALGGVDFLPTILGVMGVPKAGQQDGRDASKLFTEKDSSWEDVSFIRGTGESNWISAMDKRYKLILSQYDEPWLVDKVKDPDELTNYCFKPECREVVRKLASSLKQYGEKYNDKSLIQKRPVYDLAWAMSDKLEYDAASAPKVEVKTKTKSKKKSKKKK